MKKTLDSGLGKTCKENGVRVETWRLNRNLTG